MNAVRAGMMIAIRALVVLVLDRLELGQFLAARSIRLMIQEVLHDETFTSIHIDGRRAHAEQ
jgi:hypothetical protein